MISVKQSLITKIAGADLSALQFTFVKLDTDTDKVVTNASAAVASLGILQNSPKLNEPALIAVQGSGSYLVASAAITAGAAITATTGGAGLTTVTDKDKIGARAISTTTGTSSLVEVIVTDFTLSI